MNMLAVIVPKSDQINADDLIGRTMDITVRRVDVRPGTEQPVTMHLEGHDKVFRPCKGVCRVLVAIWGADAKQYEGRSMTIYRDPDVTWAGVKVGGIRISHMSDINSPQTLAISESKKVRKPYTIKPMRVQDRQQAEVKPAGLTIEDARRVITDAGDLDSLKAVWSGKAMAPFRAELTQFLNDRKAALGFEDQPGPDDSQRGETHTGVTSDKTAQIIADLDQVALNANKINGFILNTNFSGLSAEDEQRIRDRAYERIAEIKGGGE